MTCYCDSSGDMPLREMLTNSPIQQRNMTLGVILGLACDVITPEDPYDAKHYWRKNQATNAEKSLKASLSGLVVFNPKAVLNYADNTYAVRAKSLRNRTLINPYMGQGGEGEYRTHAESIVRYVLDESSPAIQGLTQSDEALADRHLNLLAMVIEVIQEEVKVMRFGIPEEQNQEHRKVLNWEGIVARVNEAVEGAVDVGDIRALLQFFTAAYRLVETGRAANFPNESAGPKKAAGLPDFMEFFIYECIMPELLSAVDAKRYEEHRLVEVCPKCIIRAVGDWTWVY